jgi:hypothetical protein
MTQNTKRVSNTEIEDLSPHQARQLNFLSRFYFEVIIKNQQGLITKPSPRQFLNFVISNETKK